MRKTLCFVLCFVLAFAMLPGAASFAQPLRELALEVELEAIDSALFSMIGYDEENGILVVEFREDGSRYAFYEGEPLDGSAVQPSVRGGLVLIEEEESVGLTYILNTNSRKFHYPSCKSVGKMKESNKEEFTGSREELIARGYEPCGNCKP